MKKRFLGLVVLVVALFYGSMHQPTGTIKTILSDKAATAISAPIKKVKDLSEFKEFSNYEVYSINGNKPKFSDKDLSLKNGTWQTFTDLDPLNRVGVANAMLHKRMMPTEERGDIQNVYPTGWHQKKINDKWLYNRSHVIGYQLTGENDNWKNLFTGTEQMNQKTMVEFENKVAEYLRKTGNHVRYRVTPKFNGEELVCRGIQMEAQSIEDDQLSFNVFIYNIESGVTIDYATGTAVSDQ